MRAILGATGYIGASLASVMAQESSSPLHLFSRSPEKLLRRKWPSYVSVHHLREFRADLFDLIVNAIGAGDPSRVAAMRDKIVELTQRWDDCILSRIKSGARYVFLSSGAVYDCDFLAPVCDETALLCLDERLERSPYVDAKLRAEARHRLAVRQSILDVRIFGYADESLDINGTFFLSELARSIIEKTSFSTSSDDMVRDYAGAVELMALIDAWLRNGAPNCALDLRTLAPISKNALLQIVRDRYGLEVLLSKDGRHTAVGTKSVYASTSTAATRLGYRPNRTSTDIVLSTLDALRWSQLK